MTTTPMTTKTKTKRTMKKKNSLLHFALASGLAAFALAALIPAALGQAPAAYLQKKHSGSYALLYGTVFYSENDFLVRGARISVQLKDTKKRWDAATNEEGSFAIRLPAGKGVYVVEATMPGRQPDRKEVTFEDDERVDVVLHLKGK